MKKMLFLAAALLITMGAGAQLKQSSLAQMPVAQMKEMKMGTPGMPAQPRLNANRDAKPYYIRPAGAFYATLGYDTDAPTYYYLTTNPYLVCKPYTYYTFKSVGDGVSPNATYTWFNSSADTVTFGNGRDFTVRYEASIEANKYYVPVLNVKDADSTHVYYMGNTDSDTHNKDFANVLSALNYGCLEGNENCELLVSSKTICWGGRWGDFMYPLTYYSGADPYGDNGYGYWFGKNAGRVNGIAQAFEKPTAPYILKNVALGVTELNVAGPVQMTCKVYKLNGIPVYDEEKPVTLDDQIGEQIATGVANLDASSTDNSLITFTLYDVNGIQTITPVIDDAILIVIEGYNSAWMSNLADFSALVSTDDQVDEGYGELAYIKTNYYETEGDLPGEYKWLGLNNFFNGDDGNLTMKTGFSIFMVIDQPYIGFYNSLNPGVYTFPASGGLMQQQYSDDTPQERSIRLISSSPYSADEWSVAKADGGYVPIWLHLIIQNNVDFVNVRINADALPAGTPYREVTLRFSIPGAYIDYTFKQGEKLRGDVDGNGEVDINDVTLLIDVVLGKNVEYDATAADCNIEEGDGSIDINDVTALIGRVLTGNW